MGKVELISKKIKNSLFKSQWCRVILTLLSFVSAFLFYSKLGLTAQPPLAQNTSPAIEQPTTANTPKTCKVGAYLISLYDFDLGNDSFSADLWLWSTCPSAELQPLKTMDIVNGKNIKTSLYATYKREKGYWSYIKVSGIFRQDWDVHNFPFDRHTLQIVIENTSGLASDFKYIPDKIGSKYSQDINLDGWRITDFKVSEKTYEYTTTFGDTNVSAGTSKYTRLYIEIFVTRDSAISFFKICAPVYIAFGVSLLAYFLDVATGTGLLAATLFAVVVNQQVSESILSSVSKLTLVDMIHLTAMGYILATAVVIVFTFLKFKGDIEQPIINIHRRSFNLTWISYGIINIMIIVAAAIIG